MNYNDSANEGVSDEYAANPTFPVVCNRCPEVCEKIYEDAGETRWRCRSGHERVFKKPSKKNQES